MTPEQRRADLPRFTIGITRSGDLRVESNPEGEWVAFSDLASAPADEGLDVERPFRTAEDIRVAIDEACPLNNPRLSEVDWAAVGRAFDKRRQKASR